VKPLSRRTRRVLPALLAGVLALGLTSCGDDPSSEAEASSSDLGNVSVEGDVGSAPKVTFDDTVEVDDLTSETLVEGDGEEVESGDQVMAHIWIGNGFTKEKAYSTYDDKTPQQLTVDEKQLSEVFLEGFEGHTIGSRVLVAAPAADAFGEAGNPQLGIGNKDTVVVIVDLLEMYQPPEPQDVPQSQMPTIVEKKGVPVSLDFSGVKKPAKDGDLLRTVVKEGDGEEITTDSTIKADYLGMVYGGKQPFDESFSSKPAEFALTGVVQGWTYGLSGLKVGSRVLLAIPPALGYGGQAQPNIPADSTLYFVVDIVSAK